MPNAEHELDRHGSNGQSEMPRELYDPDDPRRYSGAMPDEIMTA